MRIKKSLRLVFAATLFVPAAMPAQEADMTGHSYTTARDSGGVRSLLTSPLGSRGPSGSAALIGTTLRIEWTGDQAASARTWSVRRGACARDEGVSHASTESMPLATDAAGQAEVSAEVGVRMPSGKVYVVVHQTSSGQSPVVLACGALSNGAVIENSVGAMDHSAMNHSAMAPPSKDLSSTGPSKTDPAKPDPSKTDPSAMDHSGMSMGTPKAGGENTTAGVSGVEAERSLRHGAPTGLMAIHERMMADPVIRERVRTDPVLQRMINELHADWAKMRPTDSTVAPKTPTAKSTHKKSAPSKPVVKPTPKTAAPAMPGMDHSQMPGMKKPPS